MAEQIMCPKCSAPNPAETVFCGKCGAKLDTRANTGEVQDPLIGTFVGDRFLVHEKLGEGGMGVVYRAEQTAIKRPVALKVLHPHLTRDESLHARFHNEASASSRLSHPNTITIYDFGQTKDGSLYIAMEFVKGTSLDHEISRNGPLEWRRACRILAQIAGSLQDAHNNSIVHRDLKPENVMLCERAGERDVVKVLDFGIAKILEEGGQDQRKALTKTGMVFGTPQYMSPEQIRGEAVDSRTDIYSLGVIAYQALTGILPFQADTPMGLLTKHLMDEPPPLQKSYSSLKAPAEVEAAVMACLAKDREQRPKSMRELADHFLAAAGAPVPVTTASELTERDRPAPTLPSTVVPPAAQVARKTGSGKGLVAAAVAAAVVVLAGGGAAAWYFLSGPGAAPTGTTQGAVAPPIAPPPVAPPMAPPVVPPTVVPPVAPPPVPAPVQPAEPPETPGKGKGGTGSHTTPKGKGGSGSVDSDTGGSGTGGTGVVDPGSKPKDVACSFSGGPDPVAVAVRRSLKASEEALRKCAGESGGQAVFSFQVAANENKLSNITPRIPSSMAACVKAELARAGTTAEKEAHRGNVVFLISKASGTVRICQVRVDASPAGLVGTVNPLPGGQPGKRTDNRSDDKTPNKGRKTP
ncbi:MAG: serine/threonine protein kinase [Deltaproteobacteria bacterium]|nr:serine/threonine protein kinase [Deltaproteobacteria bacterium]